MKKKSFGDRVFELRMERNLSQPRVGKLGGMTHGQVSYYESGRYKQRALAQRNGPSLRLLFKFAKAFGMTIDELVKDVDPGL